MAFIYIIMGAAGYYKFGADLTTYNYDNILVNAAFSRSPLVLCNFLLVFFVCVNGVLKFKPAKDLITGILRENQRDSDIWHCLIITILHLSQTIMTCLIIYYRISVRNVLILVAGITGPAVYFVFPFLLFHKTFYYDKRFNKKRYFFYGLMVLAVFVNVITIGSLILDHVFYML